MVYYPVRHVQGRVKHRYICMYICVSSTNTVVCCLTTQKLPRDGSLPLTFAIHIRKMPKKSYSLLSSAMAMGF